MGKIISGFSNIGKSFLCENTEIFCIDLDTCFFNKINNWVNIYIECILALKEKYDFVLITTYGDVLVELEKRKIDYILVYPKKELKDDYKKRAINRGSDLEFINGFFNNWDKHINDCKKRNPSKSVVLDYNQYLKDVINELF